MRQKKKFGRTSARTNAKRPSAPTAISPGGEIVLYQAAGGKVTIDVRLEHETVWLSLNQMARLFARDKSVISRHIRNVFESGELEAAATVAKYATVQKEGRREVVRDVDYYNLDAVLSVGYRVNSKQGTRFRIWATQTLREHILRGYTLNEKRLRERGLAEAEQAIALLSRTLENQSLVNSEGRAVLEVIQHYTHTWRLLLEYDEDRLPVTPANPATPSAELSISDARAAIGELRVTLAARQESTHLFGQERGDQLQAILGAIEQTFGGEPLYPTVQARAAHLLYFVIKDHPFADGNKRVGTLLFLEYLRRNKLLLDPGGQPFLADQTLVALALLVAESDPQHKELMIRLVLNLLP